MLFFWLQYLVLFTLCPLKERNQFHRLSFFPFFYTEDHTIDTMMKNSFTLSIAIVQDKWLINSVVSFSDGGWLLGLSYGLVFPEPSMQPRLTIIAWTEMSSLFWFHQRDVPFVSSLLSSRLSLNVKGSATANVYISVTCRLQ